MTENLGKILWRDVKEWEHILMKTHRLMLIKFTPHFYGYEDDLLQEMMIALIKGIRRIKRGEIKSQQNFLITTIKYAAYKVAKKVITYDRTTAYLEDITLAKGKSFIDSTMEWQDLFDMGYFSYETILSTFETFEERFMVLTLIGRKGYSKTKLKQELHCKWEYINELEHRVKEKLREVIKMYCAGSSNENY